MLDPNPIVLPHERGTGRTSVRSIAISPSGSFAAAGIACDPPGRSRPAQLAVWEIDDARRIEVPIFDWCHGMAFLTDTVLAISVGKRLVRLDLTTMEYSEVDLHDAMKRLFRLPDGGLMGLRRTKICRLTSEGDVAWTVQPPMRSDGYIRAATVHSTGRYLALSTDGRRELLVYACESGELIDRCPTEQLAALAFDPLDRFLAVCEWGGELILLKADGSMKQVGALGRVGAQSASLAWASPDCLVVAPRYGHQGRGLWVHGPGGMRQHLVPDRQLQAVTAAGGRAVACESSQSDHACVLAWRAAPEGFVPPALPLPEKEVVQVQPPPPVPDDLADWPGFPLSRRALAALQAVGASWRPDADPVAGFPPPFDRVAGSLAWPEDLLDEDERPVRFQGWHPEEPEFPLLQEDPRRWVMIGEVGEGTHLVFLALDGDDPAVVVLDHDFSEDDLSPEPLSTWLSLWQEE